MSELSIKGRRARFANNVIWNSLSVLAGLAAGLLLSPYLIRKLGADGYGVWALSFALVEYYWLLDFGLRSATVKFVAHHGTLKDSSKVDEVISTSLVYSSVAASFILLLIVSLASWVQHRFQIAPAYQQTFVYLIIIASVNWCIAVVLGVFGAAMEAFQRFDLVMRPNILGTITRTGGTFLLLYKGYGLLEIGILTAVTQLLTFGLQYLNFRKAFPNQHVSPALANMSMLKTMMGFGVHTFFVNVSQQFLAQSAPLLIGHFLPTMFVGFYSLPVRLLQYSVDLIGRIGAVINSNAAEMSAREDHLALGDLAVFANRYSLLLFMPMTIFLATQGRALFQRWVGTEFANNSAPVLPVLLLGCSVAQVGQYCSTMLLQGLGKHQTYARGLIVEALLGITALYLAIPRYGIWGAAWVSTSFMIMNRFLFIAWLTSRAVNKSFLGFLRQIYVAPVLAAIPVAAIAWWLHLTVLPGVTWAQLGAAGILTGLLYYPIGFFFVLSEEHRSLAMGWLGNRARTLVLSRP